MERTDLTQLIVQSSVVVGLSGPKIADDLLPSALPGAYAGAKSDGPLAVSILRQGFVDHVRGVIKDLHPDADQGDFADIDSGFIDLVKPLKSKTYTVPSIGVRVAIADLIRMPRYLDEARQHMRQKGDECIAEAKRLDALFEAVTGSGPVPANDQTPQQNVGAA